MNIKSSIIFFLRWIFFLPIAVLIYVISKICISSPFIFFAPNLVNEIEGNSNLGGHYFWGILFIFFSESFAIGFGVYSGIYVVPLKRWIVFVFIIITWCLYIFLVSFLFTGLTFWGYRWEPDYLLLCLTEIFAQIVGFIGAGIYIWKDFEKHKEMLLRNNL
jgi:hypothetical protein